MAASTSSKPVLWKMTWPIFIELLLQMLVGNIDRIYALPFQRHRRGCRWATPIRSSPFYCSLSRSSVWLPTILISQYLGAGQQEKVQQVYVLSAVVNLAVSLVLMALLLAGGRPAYGADAGSRRAQAEAAVYLRITAVSLPFQALMLTFSAFPARPRPHDGDHAVHRRDQPGQHSGQLTALIYGLGPLPQLARQARRSPPPPAAWWVWCLLLVSFLRSIPGATLSPRMLNPWPRRCSAGFAGHRPARRR